MSTIAPETASAAGRSVASDHSSASKGDQASTPTNFRMKAQEAEEYVFDVVGKLKENKFVVKDFTMGGTMADFLDDPDHPLILFSGNPPKVAAYDDARLTRIGWVWAWKGTVLHSYTFWLQLLSYWLIALIAGLISQFGNDNASLEEKQATANLFNQVSTVISSLLAFILGLYQSEALSRWWKIINEGVFGISAALQDTIIYATSFLGDASSETVRDARQRILTYCKYAFALTLRRVSGHAHQLSRLVESDPLSEEEVVLLQKYSRQAHNTIWGWICAQWNDVYSRGLLPGGDEALRSVVDSCNAGRRATSLVDRYVNVQIPFEYYHLLVLIAKLFLIFFSLAQGTSLQIRIQTEEWFQFVVNAFVLFIIPAFYEGILKVLYEIRNPFADFGVCLDLDKYMNGLLEQVDSYSELPSFITPKYKAA